MMNRRRFVQTLAAAAATPACQTARTASGGRNAVQFGALKPDPGEVLDLPAGFSYKIISRAGEEMDDGLLVPDLHDGMAAFPGEDGTVMIVCNHENHAARQDRGPFGENQERLNLVNRQKIYDYGEGTTPGTGGTTTIQYDLRARERRRIHLSLAGTEINCSGGPTPWNSWLTCEEIFKHPGTSFEWGSVVHRSKKHGYIYEVSAYEEALADPVPLTSMGRFEHEAAAVHPGSGVVYLTEDRHRSLLYRFIPDQPGKLREGGQLQALAVRDRPRFDSRNWGNEPFKVGTWLDTRWVNLDEPDVAENDLRLRGHEQGAALFARGEGICLAGGDITFTCTIGGAQRLGQIFSYRPSPAEGTAAETADPGKLGLIAESTADSILRNADNVTFSPWGDLIVCEDTAEHCGLVGVRPDGQQYPIADNVYTSSELAGICFSPDGSVMFVNIQVRGITLAITGPWPTRSA